MIQAEGRRFKSLFQLPPPELAGLEDPGRFDIPTRTFNCNGLETFARTDPIVNGLRFLTINIWFLGKERMGFVNFG